MLRKSFAFQTKEVDESEGTFTGYASVFGNRDLGGDIVEPGAFTRTLKEKNGKFPPMADHSWGLAGRLGIVEAEEDKKGLKVKGFFNLAKEFARDTYSDVRQALDNGMAMGMSFGYDVEESDFDKPTSTLHLKDLTVFEASITQFPMNPAAGVTDVKAQLEQIERMSAEERRELIKALSAGLGLYDPVQWTTGTVTIDTSCGTPTNFGAQDSEAIATLETLTERLRALA